MPAEMYTVNFSRFKRPLLVIIGLQESEFERTVMEAWVIHPDPDHRHPVMRVSRLGSTSSKDVMLALARDRSLEAALSTAEAGNDAPNEISLQSFVDWAMLQAWKTDGSYGGLDFVASTTHVTDIRRLINRYPALDMQVIDS